MEYRGIEYSFDEGSRSVWKWTVTWRPTITRTGQESSKETAIAEAEHAIDQLLVVEKTQGLRNSCRDISSFSIRSSCQTGASSPRSAPPHNTSSNCDESAVSPVSTVYMPTRWRPRFLIIRAH